MSRAKELMAAAYPLPWAADKDGTIHVADGKYPVIAGRIGSTRIVPHPDDAALIVYAVNHLPDYEAAVEALERLVASHHGQAIGINGGPDHRPEDFTYYVSSVALDAARAALARLREVPVNV